jgi:hypothetical protein
MNVFKWLSHPGNVVGFYISILAPPVSGKAAGLMFKSVILWVRLQLEEIYVIVV